MPIKNKTKNKILVNKLRFCNNFLNKSIGLIFHKKLIDKGLVFPYKKDKKVPLHMIFVFFPIDIIYLDKEKKVIEIKENFKPFTFYTPKNKSRYVLELPENTIKKTKTEIGDILSF
ncbi:MAG: DUF192 domain-containing protein [Candidatus Woesearchaeota archaeon]|jgi:hypothetical protein|nr:DUF192 domain-containing protein [Candidatus Woesearchaeota archaeon]